MIERLLRRFSGKWINLTSKNSMQRIYYPEFRSWYISSDHPLYHQITRVLRARIGMEYVLFSGDGSESVVTIDAIDRKWCSYTIEKAIKTLANPTRYLRVIQALPNKFEKLEYVVEKWVECGVSEFVFFPSKYSQIRSLDDKKIGRLQKIAMEAVEQCGRSDIVTLSLSSWIPILDEGKSLFLHTGEKNMHISDVLREIEQDQHITLLVGPEGWWSPDEVTLVASSTNVIGVNLGTRILRLETVTPAIAFMLMNWY